MYNNMKNILGPAIKYFRKIKRLTQEDLTARINIHGVDIDRPMLTKIETQKRYLSDIEMTAIVKALNIDYDDLFNYYIHNKED